MRSFGGLRKAEDYPEPEVEFWEENEKFIMFFDTIRTQFRYTQGFATGLDYNVVHRELDDIGLTGAERDEWKAAVRVMERVALSHLNRRD